MLEISRDRTSSLNLQSIEVFCEVVKRRSFSKGAESLSISQSAASQQVAHLEQVLGLKLLDRSYRPLQVTEDGELYYKGCQHLLEGYRGVLDQIRRKRNSAEGQVRVVSIYSVGLHTLDDFVRSYMQENTGSTVRLEYYHPVKVYEAILNDEAEVGVMSYPRSSRHVEVIPWLEEEMILACPAGHPLAKTKKIDAHLLAGANFVAFEKDLKIRREVDRFFRENEIQVNILSEFDNIETIKQALDISTAVSILPAPGVAREVERGTISEVRLKGVNLRRPLGIVVRKGRELTATARNFISFLMGSSPGVPLELAGKED
jgi:DNA-binding transcriptional LysR family regulator